MSINVSLALAQKMGPGRQFEKAYDPYSPPDDFTVWDFAPDYLHPFLHEHWKTQKAIHPMWSYLVGLYFLVLGMLLY